MKELNKFKKNSCACEECVSFCRTRPGWFRPKEIPPLVEFLKSPIERVFRKYLIADFWIGDSRDIYVLSPMKDLDHSELPEHELITIQKEHNKLMGRDCDCAGRKASWGYAFLHAPCIFLKKHRCSIHPVKPFECAIVNHDKTPNTKNIRELVSREWRNDHLIETLLNKSLKN